MPLIASSIPNLVSGVSQQPAPSRLPTSGTVMENAFPSIVSGLMKRPPSEFIKELSPAITVPDSAAVHMIDRDATEQYIMIVGQGDLELYDTAGVQQTVTFPSGKAYLPTTDIYNKSRFVTVADTTFYLNTEKVTGLATTFEGRDDPTEQGSVFVKRAVASVSYAIYINGVLKSTFVTSDNTTAGTALEGTAEIAIQLAADLVSNGVAGAVATGTVVTFPITSGDAVTVLDQFGGAAMKAYTSELQSFEDLPPIELDGRLINIKGDLDDNGEDYWVEFDNGVWTETYGFGELVAWDSLSMPHVLVKTAPNTFTFGPTTWADRIAGDIESNPLPSFHGTTINNMFLFKGRLGFLSEENVILSEVGELENYFRTTVIQSLASDPIDVASTTGRVSTLYHSASFSDELILFSDKQQFRLSSGPILSGESVGITNSTAYPASTVVPPVTTGASAFFLADGATHSIAREIFIDGDRETVNGENIAVQVPSYIPLNIRAITASASADVFMALSDDVPNELYVYKWYTSNRQKVQSAWCKWVFDDNVNIVGMGFLDQYLYLVYKVGADVRFDRILVGPIIDKDLLLDHQLDKAAFTSITYDGGADETTIVLPYGMPSTVEFYKTDALAFEPYSENVTVVRSSETTYVIPGDVTADSITAGINYQFLYEFSEQWLREDGPEGQAAIQDGRLQMRFMSLVYTETTYFDAVVTHVNGITDTYNFNGRTLADPDNIVDLIPKDTGEFKFPVFGENQQVTIELKNSQPYECSFGSVEWTAMYFPKARRR